MMSETQVVTNISTSKIAQGVGIPDALKTLTLDHGEGGSSRPWGARDYLDRGWGTIPIKKMSKQPAIPSWKAYQDRRPTHDEITAWDIQYPDCNVAVICGAVSGLVVLDIDSEDGRLWLKKNGCVMPPTPRAESSPGKAHFYFQHPGGVVKNMIRKIPGIDIKGDGGYVVAPPSIHPSGATYRWIDGFSPAEVEVALCPPWLLELLEAPREEVTKAPQGGGDGTVTLHAPELDEDEDWVTGALRGVEEGLRNSTCARLAGYFLGTGQPPGRVLSILLTWNLANKPPMAERDVETTVNSIARAEASKRLREQGASLVVGTEAVGLLSEEESRESLISGVAEKLGIPLRRVRRIGGEPPQFILTIGDTEATLTSMHLTGQTKFRQKIIEACDIYIPAFKGNEWRGIMQSILRAAEKVEVGDEGTTVGQISWHMIEFLREHKPYNLDLEIEKDRTPTEHTPLILEGVPHISLPVFRKWLMDTRLFILPDNTQFIQLLRRIGCVNRKIWVPFWQKQVRLWSVPPDLWDQDHYRRVVLGKVEK